MGNCGSRKRKRDCPPPPQTMIIPPELLLEEVVWEILIRLPVKSLARFKLVSKAWHAIISDPLFVRAHLHRSQHRQRREPSSFLIAPHIYVRPEDPYQDVSTNICLYSCSTATLLYQSHIPAGEFEVVSRMAHCDGLVLLPTNTIVYVFNPATRDAIALPKSHRNMMEYINCLPVARSFYRGCDDNGHITMGMEVLTINCGGQDEWRETLVDPPALISCPQTATCCKGYLFYFIDNVSHPCPPRTLLRFDLQHETFGFTPLLDTLYPQVKYEDIILHELDGGLCATFFAKCLQHVAVCMTRDVMDPIWSLYYTVNVSSHCFPMAYATRVLLAYDHLSYCYYLQAHGAFKEDVIFDMDDLKFLGLNGEDTLGHAQQKKKWWFDLVSYTESLVPVTPPKPSLHALGGSCPPSSMDHPTFLSKKR
ncbi:hypothetical protein VPH35_070815 [Triticum aestivum]